MGRPQPGAEDAAFTTALQTFCRAGRAAWPDVDLDPEAFANHVTERLPVGRDPSAALGQLRAGDLYLACGCAHAQATALMAFERTMLPAIAPALARLGVTGSLADEVRQAVRVRLLVARDDRPPRIADYPGLGQLAAFVRLTAHRLATDLRRRRKTYGEPQTPSEIELYASADNDAEREFLKRHLGAEFSAAFRAAIAGLTARERLALKLHFLDHLSLEQVAALLRVHRATVARWIQGSRAKLVRTTHQALSSRLRLTPSELDELGRLLQSRIEFSLSSADEDASAFR